MKTSCALAAWPYLAARGRTEDSGVLVNDIHSQLNSTRVARIVKPHSLEDLRAAILWARSEGKPISVAGGRHAMGGQQFGADNLLIDMNDLNRVLRFDPERGIVEIEAGIQWPRLIDSLLETQSGREKQWGIVQKQTGADNLSLGGALASNIHSRGLTFRPIVQDVGAFTLMDSDGELRRCSRAENAELFRLVIGGYGLFGLVTSIELRLAPRRKLERVVELIEMKDVMPELAGRIADGFLYGDFQFATESKRDSFLRRGVFSCYRPVDMATPIPAGQKQFSAEDWGRLTYYAHKYKARAFNVYTKRYLQTSGQIYWSDLHQVAYYLDNYHEGLDRKLHSLVKATEMITEIYVPREAFVAFMEDARVLLREMKANLIYGTVRLIEKDEETFLRWAKEPYACIVFNLHIAHSPAGIEGAARAFCGLIDLGIRHGGSYYLTYHRWASHEQVLSCYPQFPEFLKKKREYDPDEMFQSDWYRHYKSVLEVV